MILMYLQHVSIVEATTGVIAEGSGRLHTVPVIRRCDVGLVQIVHDAEVPLGPDVTAGAR